MSLTLVDASGGTFVLRSLITGTDPPLSGTGSDGDLYINVDEWVIYGPKAAGAWGAGTNLVGPPGGYNPDDFDAVGEVAVWDGSRLIGSPEIAGLPARVEAVESGRLSFAETVDGLEVSIPQPRWGIDLDGDPRTLAVGEALPAGWLVAADFIDLDGDLAVVPLRGV